MNEFKDRNCPACGAPLLGGSYYCEYCKSDWTPAKPKENVIKMKTVDFKKLSGTKSGQQLLFFILLFFFAPAAPFYMWLGTDWTRKTKILITLAFLAPLIFVIMAMVGTAILGMIGSALF